MNDAWPRLGLCGLLLLAVFSGCGVDDRALIFEYHELDSAGSAALTGSEAAGDSNAPANGGAGSLPDAGEAGVPALSGGPLASGGTTADAGASSAHGGGSALAGGASGAGVSGTGTFGGAGAAGSAGAVVSFPCGDLNLDLIDDCSQTLVQNSRFDTAVNGWDSEPSTSQVWDSNNASGKPGSGSVKVSNTAAMEQAIGSLVAGSHQCIPITPTANYDFAARVMLPVGETEGEAGVNVWLFDDEACQGNLVKGYTPISGGVVGSWTVLSGKLWIPGGVHSMYVRLVAIKPFVQPSLSVLIDDILVVKR